MKIIPLSEGSFTVDATKIFVPFNQQDDIQNRSRGSLLVEIQPFVVITDFDIILLDTGLGFTQNGQLQLLNNLKQKGINPDQVTKVLMSHLHKDHARGLTYKNEHTNQYQATFPHATCYIQKKELDIALKEKSSSFNAEKLECLKTLSNVVFLNTTEGYVDDYIRYQVTAAHSPYHQVFWIHGSDKIIFYGGDDAPQYLQMKSKFTAKYDYNGKLAMQLRQQWWQKGQEEHWTFLFYHDIKTPMLVY